MTTREEQRDVVERLREAAAVLLRGACASEYAACRDGADEIEALSSDLKRVQPELDAARAEIDRLRASQAGGVPAGWKKALETAHDELCSVREWAACERAPLRPQEIASVSKVIDLLIATLSASPPPPATDGAFVQRHAIANAISCLTAIETMGELAQGGEQTGNWAHVVDAIAWLKKAAALASSPVTAPQSDGDVLREALAPFARLITAFEADLPDDTMVRVLFGNTVSGELRVSDLRRARNAFASSPPLAATESEGLVQATVLGNGSVIDPVCQWQPIESCPEKTDVDFMGGAAGERSRGRMRHAALRWSGRSWPLWWGGPWVNAIDENKDTWPTHWMPRTQVPVSATDAVEAERAEYERGKQHGADDLRKSQQQCQHLQRELEAAKRDIAQLAMARAGGADEQVSNFENDLRLIEQLIEDA